MEKIDVIVETLSPVVLSASSNSTIMTDTRKAIPGTVLRGILAERFIHCRKLGREAHQDESFCRLFFKNLRFVDANPSKEGQRSFVLPLSMQKEKAKSGKTVSNIQDLLKTVNPEDGYKSFRGQAILKDGKLQTVDLDTSISLHMSRSDETERLVGSSQSGKIFNYESIDAGQVFQGSILGEKEDLNALVQSLDLEDGVMDCQVGRSRYTQYGTCRIRFLSAVSLDAPSMKDIRDNGVLLRLDTAYLPVPGYRGTADNLLQAVADAMGSEKFSVLHVYAAAEEVENFVGIWKMKHPRQYGLAAGSVFLLERRDGTWTEDDLERLGNILYQGIGIRREEGFGQLRVWPWQEYELFAPKEKPEEGEDKTRPPLPDGLKGQVKNILRKRILEQLRIYAGEDVEAMRGLNGSTHFFARLLDMLERSRHADSVRDALEQLLSRESSHRDSRIHDKEKERTPFERKLTGIEVRGISLEEYLHPGSGNKRIPMPYEKPVGRSWQEDLGEKGECGQLLQELGMDGNSFRLDDGEYFYEYWHGVFRLARKKAAKAKGAV